MEKENTQKQAQWEAFYNYFPEVELPVTLTDEYVSIFSKYNKPLPLDLIAAFIEGNHLFFPDDEVVEEIEDIQDIEEYMPCFRLPETKDFYAIIYWKAGLMRYEYILHTYDPKGKTIAQQVIASTTSDGTKIRQVVATIDPDLEIYIMGGDVEKEGAYNPENTKAFSLEITPMGQIIHHFEEN